MPAAADPSTLYTAEPQSDEGRGWVVVGPCPDEDTPPLLVDCVTEADARLVADALNRAASVQEPWHSGWYLARFERPKEGYPGQLAIVDGAHSDPSGVAKARKIYAAIGLPSPDTDVMVYITEAPPPAGEINEDAAAACRSMFDAAAR